jgi:N-acetylneuraminic acid mutarotase
MKLKLIKKANEVYKWRRTQITDLWYKLGCRAETTKISLSARQLDEADVIFEGFVNKNRSLMRRLDELDSDYNSILLSFERKETVWSKLFGWLPFMIANRTVILSLKDFISKWEEYEPGW